MTNAEIDTVNEQIDREARKAVMVFVNKQQNDVTAWMPEPGTIVVYDWTSRRRLARGRDWFSVAVDLRLTRSFDMVNGV